MFRSPFLRREVRSQLVYYDTYQMATTALAPQFQVFRPNSMFDPDLTNVGHQPLYRDQIAAIYQNYRVLKATFHWSVSTSNTNNGLMTLATYNQTPPSTLIEVVEFSRRPPYRLTQYEKVQGSFVVDIATVLGLESDDYANNSLYNTAIGSNPSVTPQVQFGWYAATTTDTGCSLSVTIVFDVLFMTPAAPGTS